MRSESLNCPNIRRWEYTLDVSLKPRDCFAPRNDANELVNNTKHEQTHNHHKLDGLRFLAFVNSFHIDNQFVSRKNIPKSVNLCKHPI